jgi:hypothetical protein
MVRIVHGKDIADILTKNGFETGELVDSILKNEFGNSRDQT